MGYMKHHAIVVTGFQKEKVEEARNKAVEIFEKCCKEEIHSPNGKQLVSEIITGIANVQLSFFIAPDGSKEGWDTSDNADEARKQFLDWLKGESYTNYCDYAEITFGGDDDHDKVIRSKDKDRDNN